MITRKEFWTLVDHLTCDEFTRVQLTQYVESLQDVVDRLSDRTMMQANSVEAVLDSYRSYHPRFASASKHARLVTSRLKEGWSVDDLISAIHACHRSPWHCGDNERGRKYQSLDLILRSSDKVQMFIELGVGGQPRVSGVAKL